MKECTKCGDNKKKAEFYKKKNGGLSCWCKECIRERNRKRYHERKEESKQDKEKKKNYHNGKYVHKEKKYASDKFYYRKAKHCYCNSINGDVPCAYCSLKEERLIKHLKRNDEDFWDETTLTGLAEKRFEKMMKENGVENIS